MSDAGTLTEFYAVLRKKGRVFGVIALSGDRSEYVEVRKNDLYRQLRRIYKDSSLLAEWVGHENGDIDFRGVIE